MWTAFLPQIHGYECPIKNVTGNANEKIQNKNLAWNGWAEDFVNRINNNYQARLETKDDRNCLRWGAAAGYRDYDNKYMFKIPFKANIQYTFVFDIFTEVNTGNITIQYADGTVTSLSNIEVNKWNKVILSSTANKTIKYLRVQYNDGASDVDLDTFMVLEGAYTAETIPEYVSHTEQNLPFSLKSKNLYNNNGEITNYYINNSGQEVIEVDGDTFIKTIIDSNIANDYVISFSEKVGVGYSRFAFFNGNTFISRVVLSTNDSYVHVPPNTTKIDIRTDKRTTKYFKDLQIEAGTTATSYEPYYDIRAMQGTTLEDDGRHDTRKQRILNGTEFWSVTTRSNGYQFVTVNPLGKRGDNSKVEILSNYFKGIKFNDRDTQSESIYSYEGDNDIRILTNVATNVDDFKQWLSTHNVTVEFILAEEETTAYNSIQQAQYEAIKNARSYVDKTIISSTSDELGFDMSVEALEQSVKQVLGGNY